MCRTELNDQTIYVYIQTYELGKDYLIRALDSIRNQTYTNFRCLVFDRGSGNEVRKKLQDYVERDKRFSLTFFEDTEKKNMALDYGIPEILHLAGNQDGFFCRVDADDELELDCFEEMLRYAQNIDADMVVSASCFIDANTNQIVGVRKPYADVVIEGDEFESCFPQYYQIMRTHWAKLYKLDVIKRMNLSDLNATRYGEDTLFVREALLRSKRIGLLSKPLYRYYMYSTAKSYNLDKKRLDAPKILFERDLAFLMKKCGHISVNTIAWLINVYIQENKDVLKLIINSNTVFPQKINEVYSVLSAVPMRLAMNLGMRENFDFLCEWLLHQNIMENAQTISQIAEMFGILGVVPDCVPGRGNADDFVFLMKLYEFWDDFNSKSILEKKIMRCAYNSILLQKVDFYYCRFNSDLVETVLRENYDDAYKLLKESVQKKNVFGEQFTKQNIELGLNLTAILGMEDEYVFINKIKIEFMIQENLSEAMSEVEEWLELLPNDEDFLQLKARMIGLMD